MAYKAGNHTQQILENSSKKQLVKFLGKEIKLIKGLEKFIGILREAENNLKSLLEADRMHEA